MSREQSFDPLDLEVIHRVYEFACAHLEGQSKMTAVQEELLRTIVVACAGSGPVDFDTLCEEVLANMNVARLRPATAAASG